MGASNGTGRPFYFRCSNCRKGFGVLRFVTRDCVHQSPRGYVDGQLCGYGKTLTERVRESTGQIGMRNSPYTYEYKCACCGHVGWSKHSDLEHAASEQGIISIDKSSGVKRITLVRESNGRTP